MNRTRTAFFLSLALSLLPPARAAWKPANGQLMTRWSKSVSPSNALPEYPRPQMVRREWRSLNGLWQLTIPGLAGQPAQKTSILVPFPIESALSGVMKHAANVTYTRAFTVPASWAGQRILLHFGAVDWQATVSLNGKRLGVHRGGYDAFTYDITSALRKAGPQQLTVDVFDPTDDGSQPRGKQVNKPGGIFYTPTTGIWQTVWLEPVPAVSIADIVTTPDVDRQTLRVRVTPSMKTAGLAVRAEALENGKVISRAAGPAGAEFRVPVKRPRLWSPSDPHLYGLRLTLLRNGRPADAVDSYFGMRKIEVRKVGGVPRMLLNGKFVFQVGTLDQGFWPDGLYTAPTDAALRYDVEITKKLGFNMIRKHVKVEPERWYYWTDRVGMLVWQDMPSGDNKTPESKVQFQRELGRMIEGRRNHPSIIVWVNFNEGWGQFDTERLTPWMQRMDPSRLVDDASGWTDKGVGNMIDTHNYPPPAAKRSDGRRATVNGEFGGLGLIVPGHMWNARTFSYRGFEDREALTRQYEQLFRRVWKLKNDPGVSGVVYTQITDVEGEANGLLTYDRALIKMIAPRVIAANKGQLTPYTEPTLVPVVPTAQAGPVAWRYTFEAPAEGWQEPGFNDSGWKEGPAGFGLAGTAGTDGLVRTVWNTPDIWIRRTFTLPAGPTDNLEFLMHHDEDAQVYVNGVLAARRRDYTTEYEETPIRAAALPALHEGENTVAIHCHNTTGGQYIDWGIVRVIQPPAKP